MLRQQRRDAGRKIGLLSCSPPTLTLTGNISPSVCQRLPGASACRITHSPTANGEGVSVDERQEGSRRKQSLLDSASESAPGADHRPGPQIDLGW